MDCITQVTTSIATISTSITVLALGTIRTENGIAIVTVIAITFAYNFFSTVGVF